MEKYYTTGQFAKKAGTTERTIRYYDKIGLLKPSMIMNNGYRKYSENDLLLLQKIISLRHLGFSIEEIYPMLSDNTTDFEESLALQLSLINKKMAYLQTLKETVLKTRQLLQKDNLQWDRVADLIRLTTEENEIVERYRDVNNLLVRIKLHSLFSTNKQGWYPWIYQQIDFTKCNRLLEIGCGNGNLWKEETLNLRHREFFLTDINSDMLEEARNMLNKDFNYMIMDCNNITFKKEYFDSVIANHLLFYLSDLSSGLYEISRVLKPKGVFYCSTYGKNHMKEISELVQEYNPRIELVENNLYEVFGLENGKEILNRFFNEVEVRNYEDTLIIDKAQPLIEYILTCSGNQNELIAKDISAFKQFVENKIKENNGIIVTKEAGIFICQK